VSLYFRLPQVLLLSVVMVMLPGAAGVLSAGRLMRNPLVALYPHAELYCKKMLSVGRLALLERYFTTMMAELLLPESITA
jgi:hypothetical protein